MSAICQAYKTEAHQNADAEVGAQPLGSAPPKKPPQRASTLQVSDPLLTVEDVARRLNVNRDWVWDHSSRKTPKLPVIRMGDGALRYRASGIEAFIDERARLSGLRLRA